MTHHSLSYYLETRVQFSGLCSRDTPKVRRAVYPHGLGHGVLQPVPLRFAFAIIRFATASQVNSL